MTTEIAKNKWKTYLDDFSRAKMNWETTVQVLNEETGAQILSDGMPFGGLTYETNAEGAAVALNLGSDPEQHQTHMIFDPKTIAFKDDEEGGTLDIEGASGTKTLITFVEPKHRSAHQ